MKSLAVAALVAASLLPSVAGAQTVSTSNITQNGEFWIDPATGCSYARAQVGSYAPTWHLIQGGARIGLTNAKSSCAPVLYSRG